MSKKQKAKQAMKHQFVTNKFTEAPLISLGVLALTLLTQKNLYHQVWGWTFYKDWEKKGESKIFHLFKGTKTKVEIVLQILSSLATPW